MKHESRIKAPFQINDHAGLLAQQTMKTEGYKAREII